MDKIDFVNSTQPALNDTNLNLMQDYIEMAINAQVSGDTLPIGVMLPYSGTSIPANWLLCDGREISRTDYAQLYNVIGTRYGVGDGSTTFNLPNMKGRVPVGYDSSQSEFNSTGKTGGEKTHTLTIDEMPSHNHTFKDGIQLLTQSGNAYAVPDYVQKTGQTLTTNNTGGGQAHNILQPYLVQRYIIKAFQTAGTVAQIVNTYSTSTTDAYNASYVNKMNSYSTTETRIGNWLGSALYRKVINLGSLPNSTYKDVAHNISNIGTVVKFQGYFYNPSNNTYKPIPYSSATSTSIVTGYVYGNYVRIITNEDDSNCTGYAVIEYTKTS